MDTIIFEVKNRHGEYDVAMAVCRQKFSFAILW